MICLLLTQRMIYLLIFDLFVHRKYKKTSKPLNKLLKSKRGKQIYKDMIKYFKLENEIYSELYYLVDEGKNKKKPFI